MPRVAICLLCSREMYETELLDHIEKIAHQEQFKTLKSMEEYREWYKTNFTVEDRAIGPYDSPWLKDVRSFGIETRMRHD